MFFEQMVMSPELAYGAHSCQGSPRIHRFTQKVRRVDVAEGSGSRSALTDHPQIP